MNEQMQIFESSEFGQVRVTIKDNEPWFVAADVCRVLEIRNNRDAISRLDDDEKDVVSTDTLGGAQSMTTVSEPGLYSLVLGSRKPQARAFKRWITHEVIPSIRKTGGYIAGQEQMSDDELLAQSVLVAQRVLAQREERIRQLQQQNTVMLPKAEYYDELVDRNLLTNFRDTAKELGVKQRAFVDWLISHHYIYRAGNGKLVPMAEYAGKYFSVKDSINESNGWVGVQTLITVKGKDHFRRLLKDNTELRIKGA